MDLSVIIPARNERFLKNTVEDVLSHADLDTEVIVVLDGPWAEPPLEQQANITVVKLPESIGQRAATNLGARLARGKYIMKLDAHCAVAEGFDTALVEAAKALGRECVQIPQQKNLHVYDRRCRACAHTVYQGPMPDDCPQCKSRDLEMVMVWKPRKGTTTKAWTFDSLLKFQYGGGRLQDEQDGIADVMTSLGACFFMDREWFFEMGGFDESHGSWGQFGVELACKAWLSGGRHVVNRNTWFAHFFRVGGIGFPYPISASQQEKAREYSRALWRGNAWPGQKRPLRWLVDKFWPVLGWTEQERSGLRPIITTQPSKGIVWYSDGRLEPRLAWLSQRSILGARLPVVAVSLGAGFPGASENITLPGQERGPLAMFRQILAGLESLDTDIVFLAEHDVLYHPSHWEFEPLSRDRYWYNQHRWQVDVKTGRAAHYLCNQTSGLCADRLLLLEHYRKRVQQVEREGFSRRNGFEPGTRKMRHGGFDDVRYGAWMSRGPNIDLRHGRNLTKTRWSPEEFRDKRFCRGWTESDSVPGWGTPAEFLSGGIEHGRTA